MIIPGEGSLDENAKRGTRDKRTTRLLDCGDATVNDPESILYQHTVFCQTGLPYRNPGDDVRQWERVNGAIGLQVNAGSAWHPGEGRFVRTSEYAIMSARPDVGVFEKFSANAEVSVAERGRTL